LQQHLETAALEKSYEKALLQIQNIHEEERSRALRVQIQLLEDENDTLGYQLAEADEDIDSLERTVDELRDQVANADVESQRLQNELRTKIREIETLKVR
jgi:predicted  nucleic acid-binding Zn-ribbon protein